jgi:hypothetical protein
VWVIGQHRFPFLNFIQQRMQWIDDFHLGFRQYLLATILMEILPVTMDKIKPIFSATTSATSGYSGRTEVDYGSQKTRG